MIQRRVPAIRLRTLAATYFRIGNTTFGGGDPTILALQKDLVENRSVLTPDQFALSYMLARITPGTNVLAFCAGTGYQLRRWRGTILAVAAVAIPSAVIAVLVSGAYQVWIANLYGSAAINATLAAAVGLMFAGAWVLVRPHVRSGEWFRTGILLSASFLLVWWAGLSPLQVMGIAAIAGALWREQPEA
jgi:chromate transporter